MFQEVKNNVSFPQLEGDVLTFWRENRIYDKSLENRQDATNFVFYEGPPTANGLPHPGHCLTRAIKDVFPRYKTMRGHRCTRKAGWDTHGLPVEVEVCKELGIHSKEEIEEYGIEPFIHRCQSSVWRYMKEWERLTERLGFWIHLDDAYVTYHKTYVESVWWSLKQLFDRGLLYKGHKIVWWWAQGGTALSSGEVGQGYREVADPSVFVRFPLVDREKTSFLIWTTTPWTLPSNQFAAVQPELQYATVLDSETEERLILAEDLVETVAEKAKREWTVESTCRGSELLGVRYRPPFDYYAKDHFDQMGKLKGGSEEALYWKVVGADFVTTESGTGVVHQAPAFGEVDYEVLMSEKERFEPGQGPDLFCAIGPDGKFTDVAPEYEGQWVKEADKAIGRRLREEGKLFHQEQYLHDYPFCWRASEDPLIQYPRESWFIRTTKFRESMLANNEAINWLPDHIKQGRFGNFLESNVDWALSRERYWGTPLPIWVCESTGEMEAIGSYDELLGKSGVAGAEVWEAAKKQNPELPDDLLVHKPYIDEVTYESPFCDGARMKRVSEVIDCWYDSGAMPFAQWGYPHQGAEGFQSQFPADFISEALDQTRGWFYSQLAISTMLFGPEEGLTSKDSPLPEDERPWPHPFQNCIVLGLMLAEWWESPDGKQRFLSEDEAREACGKKYVKKVGKMSKQLRNYRSPQEIFDNYGADALRWYFFANQPPWNSIIYSDRAIRESIPEFLLRFWNVYSFFVIYANIDGFDPAKDFNGSPGQLESAKLAGGKNYRSVEQRGELDRWVLSELQLMVGKVTECMDAYDNYGACQSIESFLDGLSNWYVRRSRDRFWAKDRESVDKSDAYWTLYECLVTMAKVVAPFVPFVSETIWRNLTGGFGDQTTESVHLCDYPTANEQWQDDVLSERMSLLREVASLGRSARMDAKLKVRQPLALVEVILANPEHQGWLADHGKILANELNVKEVAYTQDAEEYINYLVQPNFKRVGPRVGKLMPKVKKWLNTADGAALLAEMEANGHVSTEIDGQQIELTGDDLEVRLQAKEGWAAAQGASSVVVLSTDLTDEMIREGLANDLIRLVQDRRKELNLDFTDRIAIGIETESEIVKRAVEENASHIQAETLGISVVNHALDVEAVTKTVGESDVVLYIRVAQVEEAN